MKDDINGPILNFYIKRIPNENQVGGEAMTYFSKLLKTSKNFVFIGESGSGKSEIALNTAVLLRKQGKNVHVFDLDQTKALFRARDAEGDMKELGIELHYMPQLLDTPVIVNGIVPHLKREDSVSILDVGGNDNAARMIGCLSEYLNEGNTAAIYVINPFRPWSGNAREIRATMETVLNACHIERVFFVANPTLGPDTEDSDVSSALRQLDNDFPLEEFSGVFIREDLFPYVSGEKSPEYIPLHPYLRYPWIITGKKSY